MQNISRAYGDQISRRDMQRMARLAWYHAILTGFEVMCSEKQNIIGNTEVVGREHMDNALARGHGAILLVAHIGNWEALGAFMTRIIRPTRVLVKPLANPGVERYIRERRRANGLLAIERRNKGDGARAVIRALKHNEVVAFILDQARPGEPFLPFFGEPAKTNTSLAAIWKRYPVPVVPGYIERLGVGRHRVHLLPSVSMSNSDRDQMDVLALSQRFNLEIEKLIRACPHQFLWQHDRWKV